MAVNDQRMTKFWSNIVKSLGIDKDCQDAAKEIFMDCMQQAGYFIDVDTKTSTRKTSVLSKSSRGGTGGKTGYHLFYAERNQELKQTVKNGNERKDMIVSEWKNMNKTEKETWSSHGESEEPKPRTTLKRKEKISAFDSDVDELQIKPKSSVRKKIATIDSEIKPKVSPKKSTVIDEESDDEELEIKPKPKPKMIRKCQKTQSSSDSS